MGYGINNESIFVQTWICFEVILSSAQLYRSSVIANVVKINKVNILKMQTINTK